MTARWEDLSDDPAISSLIRLGAEARELAREAGVSPEKHPVLGQGGWLPRKLLRFSASYTIVVIGQVSSGKSSLVNSLLGRRLLAPAKEPTDGVISVLMPLPVGKPERADLVLRDGTTRPFASLDEGLKFLRQQNTARAEQQACREVRLYLHAPLLRHLRIVNTPGFGDPIKGFEQVTRDYLAEDESDLVIWTFFPDTAANADEIQTFESDLARRRKAVLGVVTRSLEGHETEPDYDPRTDPAFVGRGGVVESLQGHLGEYLAEVVLYDSAEARRLVAERDANPSRQEDPAFAAGLERCGYAGIQRAFEARVGKSGEGVREGKVRSFLGQCASEATNLATACAAAESLLARRVADRAESVKAWQTIEKEVVGPTRALLRDDLHTLASERGTQLGVLMGNAAADAINENFGLLGTLGRSLVSWSGLCDSAADRLNAAIAKSVEEALERDQFNRRLGDRAAEIIRHRLTSLHRDLQWRVSEGEAGSGPRVSPDPGRPGADSDSLLGDAFAGALKGAIAAVLKALAKQLEERAAQEAAKKAAEELAKQAAKKAAENIADKAAQKAAEKAAQKAAEQAAKEAAKKGAAGTAMKIASVVSLVLIPFDVAKLVRDFKKGRDNLVDTVRARYRADSPVNEGRIFDAVWPDAERTLNEVLESARAENREREGSQAALGAKQDRASELRRALESLSESLAARA
jgi:hypothetical protein